MVGPIALWLTEPNFGAGPPFSASHAQLLPVTQRGYGFSHYTTAICAARNFNRLF